MSLTYDEKAETKLAGTILRVLRSGRAKYVLSAGATTTACCTAIAVMASDAIAVCIERGDKDLHGLLD